MKAKSEDMLIPSQAPAGFVSGDGVETRRVTPKNNPVLERPAALWVEDIVRARRKSGTAQSMGPENEAPEIGSKRSKVGLPSVRIEGQYRVNCGNAKAGDGYANPQPSSLNGTEVGEWVQRLGVEEPTNTTPLAPGISASFRDEEIVQAYGKPYENLLQRRPRAYELMRGNALNQMAETVALSALLHSLIHLRILWGIRVAGWAVGLGLLPCTVSAKVGASLVFGCGDRLQMVWAHTGAITAKVIGLVTGRERAVGSLVKPMVGGLVGSCAIGATANAKTPITATVERCRPDPTRPKVGPAFGDRPVLVDLAPKAVFNRGSLSERCASWHSDDIIPSSRNNRNNQLAAY